ncbi:polyketide cyclase/dehydrase/lipid transport protein [Branchiibius hedensis]|uniref:Polyketide cyclase / dehydrase and lipid transport n=1 Tax=Branchiibius hedensis TaxID=672460 RepID=A0A2Y8ZUG7_9MICO|nr:SRPBCC family protein [Branchiibius hedensis]PWJ27249.1 polyketide cyclase/dehydrase/lipid transport protein [Branchiibius hedensis]SSA36060.1 Polyketide cyclase / dehydrase and lipid transport [Branchiibius hedensis]
MVAGAHFVFDSTHPVAAPRRAVIDVLSDPWHWDRWWPQIRDIETIDADHGRVQIRSLLPYRLRLTLTKERLDPADGVFRARLAGDLDGWAQFDVREQDVTIVHFHQEVTLRAAPWLRVLARGGRPLLRANHAWMMRSGMRGLHRAAVQRPESPGTLRA